MFKKSLITAFCITMLFIAAGCSDDAGIIGTWTGDNHGTTDLLGHQLTSILIFDRDEQAL